jgi:hypothetical protein
MLTNTNASLWYLTILYIRGLHDAALAIAAASLQDRALRDSFLVVAFNIPEGNFRQLS